MVPNSSRSFHFTIIPLRSWNCTRSPMSTTEADLFTASTSGYSRPVVKTSIPTVFIEPAIEKSDEGCFLCLCNFARIHLHMAKIRKHVGRTGSQHHWTMLWHTSRSYIRLFYTIWKHVLPLGRRVRFTHNTCWSDNNVASTLRSSTHVFHRASEFVGHNWQQADMELEGWVYNRYNRLLS